MLLEQLIPIVLLGTGKKKPPLAEWSPALHHATELAPDPETALWRALSVAVHYDQAGQCGEYLALPDLVPCPPEVKPYAPPHAQDLLRELAASSILCQYPAVAQTLLDAYAERTWLLSPDSLLSAFELPVTNSTLKAVIGKRGKWLLALMADEGNAKAQKWHKFIQKQEGETAWTEGASTERKAALAQCRQQNPALALQWLSDTWDKESSSDKLAFVQLLSIGLSVGDTTFLTQALASINALPAAKLKPQQHELRLKIAHLLAQIPESPQHRALCAALLTCWRVGILGNISYQLPDETNSFWQPDHLLQQYGLAAPKDLPAQYSTISYCVSSLLRYVPPRIWQAHLGKSAEQWVNYCLKDAKMDKLAHLPDAHLETICQASISYHDSDMAQILLQKYGDTLCVKREMAALTALLSDEAQRNLLVSLDWSKGVDLPSHLLQILRISAWDKRYSQSIMAKVRQNDGRYAYHILLNNLPLLAQCLHPEVIADLQKMAISPDQHAAEQNISWREYCQYVLQPLNILYQFFQKIKHL